jgi:hypothetical protein
MFSMGELTHEGGFGCLFVIWRCRGRENGEAHVTIWYSGTGGRAVGSEWGRTLLFDKGGGGAGGC